VETDTFIPVRSPQLRHYVNVPLYFGTAPGVYHLYKPGGVEISDVRIDDRMHPPLFICEKDRLEAELELHRGFNLELARCIDSGDIAEVKATPCKMVAETLAEPRAGTLQSLPQTIDILISGYSQQPGILRVFATISNADYTTVIHSVNVMALRLSFCMYSRMPLRDTKRLGLSALLHDVGKSEIPPKFSRRRASSPRRRSR
jgi:HD-GYP domain-containing protein (c-di-GMP phosphodiesterase class II)